MLGGAMIPKSRQLSHAYRGYKMQEQYQEELFTIMLNELTLHRAWPERNRGDILFHDKNWLTNNSSRTFIWLVYKDGSHIIPLDEHDQTSYLFFRSGALDRYAEKAHYWLCKRSGIVKIDKEAAYLLVKRGL